MVARSGLQKRRSPPPSSDGDVSLSYRGDIGDADACVFDILCRPSALIGEDTIERQAVTAQFAYEHYA